MPGAIGVRSCGVQRAAVYQRRRPERVVGWYFRTARRVTCGGARVSVVPNVLASSAWIMKPRNARSYIPVNGMPWSFVQIRSWNKV